MIERGKIDTANTAGSVRSVALSEGLQSVLDQWCRVAFPQTGESPLSKVEASVRTQAGAHCGLD